MGKNTKPMLTVLVEENKLQQFRDYALSKEVSMGWVVNKLLDRVLSGELVVSDDSYSTGNVSTGLSRDDVAEMIRMSLENTSTANLDINDIESLVNIYIDKLNLKTEDIEKIVRVQVDPLVDLISELQASTQSQLDDLRADLKKPLAIG